MLSGFACSLLWMLFFHEQESKAIGFCRLLVGEDTLAGLPWKMIDPQVIALPLAFIVFIVVALRTEPVSEETVVKAFRHI